MLNIPDANKIPPYALYAYNAKCAESSSWTRGLKYGDFEVNLENGKFVFKMDGGATISNIETIEFMGSQMKGIVDHPETLDAAEKNYYALSANTDLSNHTHTMQQITDLSSTLSPISTAIQKLQDETIPALEKTLSDYKTSIDAQITAIKERLDKLEAPTEENTNV